MIHLRKKKRECPFETYEPEKKIRKEHAFPIILNAFHMFSGIGGAIGFWFNGALMAAKGVFGVREKIRRYTDKTVEIRIRE